VASKMPEASPQCICIGALALWLLPCCFTHAHLHLSIPPLARCRAAFRLRSGTLATCRSLALACRRCEPWQPLHGRPNVLVPDLLPCPHMLLHPLPMPCVLANQHLYGLRLLVSCLQDNIGTGSQGSEASVS